MKKLFFFYLLLLFFSSQLSAQKHSISVLTGPGAIYYLTDDVPDRFSGFQRQKYPRKPSAEPER